MSANLTPHARSRMQQRGIRAEALEALLDFGRTAHVDRGREIVFLDRAARARLARQSPAAAREAERLRRTYAILGSDGAVITVGHRYRRIPRD
ncbi:MAG: DUF4258 domain-containing protein [Burkholderiaceae bacterium]|nr:DUF4258 domain-containing protein [Burkholderiaceae bacterium]